MGLASYKIRALNFVQKIDLTPLSARKRLLKYAGVEIAGHVTILHGVHIELGALTMDDGVFINNYCYLDCRAGVRLGRNVHLGSHCKIFTTTHEWGPAHCRASTQALRPVEIGDGAWLGANVMVLPGVKVAAGCIIGAGSVVTKDTLPDHLYVGTPAKPVRRVEDEPIK